MLTNVRSHRLEDVLSKVQVGSWKEKTKDLKEFKRADMISVITTVYIAIQIIRCGPTSVKASTSHSTSPVSTLSA